MLKMIQNDIKEAMKEKNVDKRDVLKMALAKAQSAAKDMRCEITDAIMLGGIQKELKQLNQTKDSLSNRQDSALYQSTIYKIDVLNNYLPKMLSEAEVTQKVKELLDSIDKKELGKGIAMKTVMPVLKGVADSKITVKCIDEYLRDSSNFRG